LLRCVLAVPTRIPTEVTLEQRIPGVQRSPSSSSADESLRYSRAIATSSNQEVLR
jgi:hypothetical protein